MFIIIRLILVFGMLLLCYRFVLKTKDKTFFKYKRFIFVVLFLVVYGISCQVKLENAFGFQSLERALAYEKLSVVEIKNTIYSENTACVIYKTKNGKLSFDTYYQNDSGRWCLDEMTVDYKWCDSVSVAICCEEKENQNYLLIFGLNEFNNVDDSFNSDFMYKEDSESQQVIGASLLDVPSIGYRLVLNGTSYVLQNDGFFEREK